MSNNVCVDYLSHEWSCSDLIKMHQELKSQRSKTSFELSVNKLSPKERKRLKTERLHQIRYENTIWRSMAKKCTQTLGASNKLVHPSQINWQKESDITWLYGPLSVSSDHPMAIANTASFLKSYRHSRHWSKVASESGKQNNVRFHPDITEVCYLPETPTKEISEFLALNQIPLGPGAQLEEEEDIEFWELMVQVATYLRSKATIDCPSITQLCISVTAFVYTALFSLVLGDRQFKSKLKQLS
ncbi:hypothetical protein A0J61_09403 [Choanephora cucurbitarum]|uniref:Uncharacterized protein n=1 Tax=Choanephora cucurbitarum TaxID=101091 RepID=A0A1C7N0C5_9FUNG|nr:hypothetical protein A0J61_09403 [Choanephora cucurbitarum]